MEIPDHLLPAILTALDHYRAYMRAVDREDRPWIEAAEHLRQIQAKPPARENGTEKKVRRKA